MVMDVYVVKNHVIKQFYSLLHDERPPMSPFSSA